MHTGFKYYSKSCWAALALCGCFIKGIVSWLRKSLSKEVMSVSVFPDSACQQYTQHEMISPRVLSHKLKGSAGQGQESDCAGSCRLLPFVLFYSIRESQRLSEER